MTKVEIKILSDKIDNMIKNDNKVVTTFKEKDVLDRLKSVQDVLRYMSKLRNNGVKWADTLLNEYSNAALGSYSEKLTLYRIVVAALTNNEESHLTTGERWYPIVQFCYPKNVEDCLGDEIIGTIISEGTEFTVVSGHAHNGPAMGLGAFVSINGTSYSGTNISFRSVSSKEVAFHISKYFGKLLFEVHYGGVNCNWHWK